MRFITALAVLAASTLVPALAATARADTLYVSNISNNTIATIASNGSPSIFADNGLSQPVGLAFDSSGNLFVSNFGGVGGNSIIEIAPNGNQSVFFNATSLPGNITLNGPTGLAFDKLGNLYVAYNGSSNIIQITPGGSASLYYSTGLNNPFGLAFDSAGNLYAANQGDSTIQKITSAGVGFSYYSTGLHAPTGLAFDSAGHLYAANESDNSIEEITGLGSGGDFVFTGASLDEPTGLAFDSAGNLYVASAGDDTIERITPGGVSSVFATVETVDGSDDLSNPRLLAFTTGDAITTPLPAVASNGLLLLGMVGIFQLLRRVWPRTVSV